MKPGFALVGCGRIGRRHAEQIRRVGRLLAVCDIDVQAARELANTGDVRMYHDLRHLLASEPEVSIISICTPNGLHAEQSILSLQAGKHVLCEKPLCLNTHDARRMLQAAHEAEKKLFVVKQNRYNPPVRIVKQWLEEDRLGKISSFQINGFWNRPHGYYEQSWRGTKDLDGGSLFTQFSHFIDLLFWFLGDIRQVHAFTRNFEHPTIAIEDCGAAILEMQQGAIGTLLYTVNSFQKNMEGSFTLFGEKGTVKIGGQYLNTLEYQCVEGLERMSVPQPATANQYGFYQGSMSNHHLVYDQLIPSLECPGYEMASALDGFKTVEIIEKIYARGYNG